MQQPPNLLQWILKFVREMVLRFGAKNPVIFNIIAWVGAILTLLTGLPLLSEQLAALGVTLPDWWEAIQSKILTGAGIGLLLVSNLPMKPEPVAPASLIIPDAKPGDVLAVTPNSKLPFTNAIEASKIEASKEPEVFTPKVTTDSTKPPTA